MKPHVELLHVIVHERDLVIGHQSVEGGRGVREQCESAQSVSANRTRVSCEMLCRTLAGEWHGAGACGCFFALGSKGTA